MMHPKDFICVCITILDYKFLKWQTKIAKLLKVSDRTVRRWVAGEAPIPNTVISELLEHLKKSCSLPKWIYGFDEDNAEYTMHAHYPRFVFDKKNKNIIPTDAMSDDDIAFYVKKIQIKLT